MSDEPHEDEPAADEATGPGPAPEMTRERARSERRDLDKERGEPVAGPRGKPRSIKRIGRPLGSWTSRPRILVTNDDGIESRGLLALKLALDPIGEVTVVAPDLNQSAVGHTKTLMRPLRVRERTLADGSTGYSVDGSPTDCVSLSFLGFFEERFDLVASGINYGANLGDDITYSGTVSAAMEAVINNCPAFAISQEYEEHIDFALAAKAAAVVARNVLEHGLRRGELLSVNVPAVPIEACGGFEMTRVGRRVYSDELISRLRPARAPLLLDRRAAAVRDPGARHGLRRGGEPADLRHADPPGPHGPAPAAPAAGVGLDARGRGRGRGRGARVEPGRGGAARRRGTPGPSVDPGLPGRAPLTAAGSAGTRGHPREQVLGGAAPPVEHLQPPGRAGLGPGAHDRGPVLAGARRLAVDADDERRIGATPAAARSARISTSAARTSSGVRHGRPSSSTVTGIQPS